MRVKGSITEKMFSDVGAEPEKLSRRFDKYTSALADAPWAQLGAMGQTIAGNLRLVDSERGNTGTMMKFAKSDDQAAQLRSLLEQDTVAKALGASQVDAIKESLAANGNISKDISLTSPVSTGLVLYDLKAPAEMLVPVDTPIVNTYPRTQGVGTSFRYKQITGLSNAQTGAGLPLLNPAITDTTQTNFGFGAPNAEHLIRGPKIQYAGQDMQAAYFQFGLSDQTSWSAEFAGAGFQDVRQLSQTSVLYASKLAEERMALIGRGTSANGYSGQLSSPTGVMGTARAAGTGETGISTSATLTVWLVAAGGFGGYAPPVQAGTGVAVTAGQVLPVTIPDTPGAQFLVFVSTGGSPTTATAYYYGTVSGSFVLQGTMPTSGTTASNAAYATNTTANAGNYDGLIPIVTGPGAGYRKNIGGVFNTSNPGKEFQDAFKAMYASNLANPDRILFNGSDRVQLSDAIKSQGNPNGYRIEIMSDGSGKKLGEVVTGIQNEVTGKLTDMDVHPYMPQGFCPILTDTLPFPNSNVSSCFEFRNVQDYMGISWPVLQFTYDFSSYWFGTFFCHAPAWQACVYGVTNQ